jgi:hypothetical protein
MKDLRLRMGYLKMALDSAPEARLRRRSFTRMGVSALVALVGLVSGAQGNGWMKSKSEAVAMKGGPVYVRVVSNEDLPKDLDLEDARKEARNGELQLHVLISKRAADRLIRDDEIKVTAVDDQGQEVILKCIGDAKEGLVEFGNGGEYNQAVAAFLATPKKGRAVARVTVTRDGEKAEFFLKKTE